LNKETLKHHHTLLLHLESDSSYTFFVKDILAETGNIVTLYCPPILSVNYIFENIPLNF
jgi:hypothetical protein